MILSRSGLFYLILENVQIQRDFAFYHAFSSFRVCTVCRRGTGEIKGRRDRPWWKCCKLRYEGRAIRVENRGKELWWGGTEEKEKWGMRLGKICSYVDNTWGTAYYAPQNCESCCTRPHGTSAAMAGGIDLAFTKITSLRLWGIAYLRLAVDLSVHRSRIIPTGRAESPS